MVTIEGDNRPTPEFKFDAIVALGENYRLGWNKDHLRKDPRHLSTDSKMVATAAAMYLMSRNTREVIFSTGHTAGDDIPSEAVAMKSYAQRKFKDKLPTSSVMRVDEESKDTSTNAEELAKKLANRGYDRVALLAPSYHRKRAMGLFEAWGVHIVKFLPAEEKLRVRTNSQGSIHHELYVQRLKRSPRWFAETIKEFLLNAERYLLFDPRGIILRKITQRTRK